MDAQRRVKKIARKILRWVAWIFASVILLLIIVALVIRIPYVQNKIKTKALAFLGERIKTPVTLGEIVLKFPKQLVLRDLYVEDRAGDTLLFVKELGVDTDMWGLLHRRIELDQVNLEGATANVYRNGQDSVFNFEYIIQAFAGDTTTAPEIDSTTVPWQFSIGNISVKHTRLKFLDAIDGNHSSLNVGSAEISMDEFDLNRSIIKADEIRLADVTGSVHFQKISRGQAPSGSKTREDDAPFPFLLGLNDLALTNVNFDYINETEGQRIRIVVGEASIDPQTLDLQKQIIAIGKCSVNKTSVLFHRLTGSESGQSSIDSIAVEAGQRSWNISVDEIEMSDNSLQYYDFAAPAMEKGIDFSHLWLTRVNIEAADLALNGNELQANLAELSLMERSGFAIQSFKGKFVVGDKEASIKDMVFVAGETRIELEALLKYRSIANLSEEYPDATVDILLKPSTIGIQDILYVVPGVLDSLPLNPALKNESIALEVSAAGKINDLTIRLLSLRGLEDTQLNARGTLKGLPEISTASLNIILDKFRTTQKDVGIVLTKKAIPSSIHVPQWVETTGKFSGSFQKPALHMDISSSIGRVTVFGKANLDSVGREPNYRFQAIANKFNLGKLLGQEETLGTTDMQAVVHGSGLNVKTLHAFLDLNVKEIKYQDYSYRNFTITGEMDHYFFSGNSSLHDKNLDFTLKGDLAYEKNVPRYKLELDLKNADLKALNISERALRTRGILSVDMATADMKVLNGTVTIRNVAIYNGEALYKVDSLLFASIDQNGHTKISLASDLMEGSFEGTINLFSLPEEMKRYVNNYFSLHNESYSKPAPPQNFTFNLMLKKTELLTDILFPDLHSFEPGPIKGEFDSRDNELYFRMSVGKINYANVGLDSFLLNINSDKKALYYNVVLNNIAYDSFHVQALRVDGTVSGDSIRSNVMLLDTLNEARYRIGGVFYSKEKEFQFSFRPGQLMLNYDPWNVPADNFVRFGNKGVMMNNVAITREGQEISAATPADKDSTLTFRFKELDLENLASMITASKKVLEGKMSGEFSILRAKNNAFHSNLKIENLAIMQKEWGLLALDVSRATESRFDIGLKISGTNTDLAVKGYYSAAAEPASVKANVTINKIDLSILEPLSYGKVKALSGSLTGDLSVDGTVRAPKVTGGLTLKEAKFTPTYVKSSFTLKDETIRFTGSGLSFSNFEILDENNSTATLSGNIRTEAFEEFILDLSLNTRNFQILNTTEEDSDLYYGKIKVNAKARITGTSDQPQVNVNVALADGSELTYIVPESEQGVLEQKGIVIFIDKDAKNDPFLASINPMDTIKSRFRGLDLTANIELTDKETFNIIVDPATGDKLSVKGNTTLTLDMDAIGNIDLSGRYEITSGTYAFSFYKFVKRNFEIEKGSTITWSGDPLAGVMDIRAIYRVETSPFELIASQETDTDLVSQYRQRLPFLVYLNIRGELLTPEISFKLDMPQEKRNVFAGNIYSRLQDINTRESDLNKQVFGLLVLKHFIADNPFESQNGFANSARTSVSRLLSDQLNRLSENIKGIELSFDVKSYEDYSTGEAAGQTQLQLGVSKNLFNERLVVKLSGNVNIEGENTNQDSFTDYIGDLALEYKITEDGRLRITGFRNSDYDMIDGELTRTGAGLIYIKDYNTLRELFKANEKDN